MRWAGPGSYLASSPGGHGGGEAGIGRFAHFLRPLVLVAESAESILGSAAEPQFDQSQAHAVRSLKRNSTKAVDVG